MKDNRYPPRTVELAKEGHVPSQQAIAVASLPLIYSRANAWVKRYPQFEPDELAAEGYMGVMRALKNYNPAKASFGTWAFKWIEHKIRWYCKKNIRVVNTELPTSQDGLESSIREHILEDETAMQIWDALDGLTPPERDSIEKTVFLGMNLDKFGRTWGYGGSWACRVRQSAIRKIVCKLEDKPDYEEHIGA